MAIALIVSPYLDHLGGGERYMLTVASVLESLGYGVVYAWDNIGQIESLASMLGIKLNSIVLDPKVKPLYFGSNPLAMYLATRPYDVVIYLSDGSFPLLGGKKNLLHIQVPFHDVNGKNWKNQLKKNLISNIIVNSNFTKKIVDAEYDISSVVLYPPVPPITTRGAKEKVILSVGRFEPSLNAKKQDVLIKAFRQLSPQIPGWKLVLAGGSSSDEWVSNLRTQAEDIPVEFQVNATYQVLCTMYSKASIYWHAAGYGIDEAKNPELTEHFGISTVEAISAGCVPIVVGKGGQTEIVTNNSLHWETIPELVTNTLAVAANPSTFMIDPTILDRYSSTAFASNLKSLLT